MKSDVSRPAQTVDQEKGLSPARIQDGRDPIEMQRSTCSQGIEQTLRRREVRLNRPYSIRVHAQKNSNSDAT
jgi:hypothetical protein